MSDFKGLYCDFSALSLKPAEPGIVEVSDITIEGGGEAIFSAKVNNVGYSEDTFVPRLDLPVGMVVIMYPGEVSVPVGQTVELA